MEDEIEELKSNSDIEIIDDDDDDDNWCFVFGSH